MLPLDLHVLGVPPAFNLSHDQTLHFFNLFADDSLPPSAGPTHLYQVSTHMHHSFCLLKNFSSESANSTRYLPHVNSSFPCLLNIFIPVLFWQNAFFRLAKLLSFHLSCAHFYREFVHHLHVLHLAPAS